MFKTRFISILALLCLTVTSAWAQNYTITLPSVSNGSVSAKVNDASVTSAAEGATVSLVATPDAGYRLQTISGTYQVAPEETLSRGATTRTGDFFTLTASYNKNWYLYKSGTITISSTYGGNISSVVLNINLGASFAFNEMTVDHGSMTIDGNVITISGINSSNVVITGTSGGGGNGCTVNSATITGTGTVDKALTLTSTGDDNVKTFTMPSGNVTVSAEFEEIPFVAVTGVTLSPTSATLTVGETETLTPTVAPDNATDKSVTWTTSDDAVATVSNEGVVTAVAAGEATITVTTTDGAKTATCTVTVAEPTYKVSLKDATSWQGKAGTGAYKALPLTGLEAGTAVSVKYNGTKKVKSVKAKKVKAAAEATAGDKGKVIGTDGKIYADVAAATAAGTTAVAMIAYVGSETGVDGYTHGLALALEDVSEHGLTWNYYVVYGEYNDGKSAAEWCSAWNTSKHVKDAEWLLASNEQWQKMGATKSTYTALRDGFESVGGSNLVSYFYWSSTPQSDEFSSCFDFEDGTWSSYPASLQYFRVRACLAF